MPKNLPDFWRGGSLGRSGSPFREISRLQRQIDELFNDFFAPMQSGFLSELLEHRAAFDVEDLGDHYLMNVEMPGVKKEDIKMELHGDQLTISAERSEEGRRRGGEERRYLSYYQSFTVPHGVTPEQIETDYKDGLLRIAIPKIEDKKSQIRIGESKTGFLQKLADKQPESAA